MLGDGERGLGFKVAAYPEPELRFGCGSTHLHLSPKPLPHFQWITLVRASHLSQGNPIAAQPAANLAKSAWKLEPRTFP